MKMRQNNQKYRIKREIAVFLSLLFCMAFLCPVFAFAQEVDGSTIHIRTQDDLKELAENCRLDNWSQGKTVVLDNNLTLDDTADEFLPIPTFGGTFEGNGHTISGLSLDGEVSRAGLFDTIQAGAVINRLAVVGQVTPSGDGDTIGGLAGKNFGKINGCSFEGTIRGTVSVGGLVGINETTGQMINCQFQGSVTGEHYVGGIAGQNTGSLIQCENHGEINTTAVEVSADISDISLLRTTESVPAGTDIGGIAGFSSGVIQSCENAGDVGYEHMGYNVGGIVGRQSGYLDGCKNTGMVNGRKDVGGITGQLEPQVTLRYDEDLLDQLWVELDTLLGLTNQAAADAQSSSDTLSGNIGSLITDINTAKDAVSGLSGSITDWSNENIQQINDIAARMSWVISESEPSLTEISDAADILGNASSLLAQAAQIAEGSGEQGKAAAAELQLASEDLQDAKTYAENCETHLRSALEIARRIVNGEDGDDVIQSLQDELDSAEAEAQNAKTSLESAITHGENAKAELKTMGDQGSGALDLLTQAMDSLNQGMSSMGTVSDQIASIVSTLAEEPDISFTPVDSNVTSQGDSLDAALSQVLNSASGLQGSISSSSDTLLSDFEAINRQLQVIVDLLQQQMEETKEKDVADSFEDISDEEAGEPTSGKIHGATNSGEVFGDVNVAGIVGSMSVEYDFDPEDDLTKDGTRSLDFQYKTLAVVTGCTNDGNISVKKNYAGGIVGRMDLGAVKACESYGTVKSSSGNYVGGVAGLSRATIRNCFVKCTLSGGDYVGGVIGASEENTVVSDCYTLVDIPDSGRYSSAVSGTEDGEFTGNYYVSDTLSGLGRISYAGKAEPLSFESFTQVEGIPEEMTEFTLRFFVEDEEIKSQSFSYGESFGADVFPEIPVKDGYYASWDTDDLTELHFDKTVTAKYERYVLTLPSQASRKSGRPVFLMDGNFDEQAVLTVSSIEKTEWIHGQKAEEQWKLSCSDTLQDSYTIRYLSPEETAEGYGVYVKQDGRWKKADYTAFGSYLMFSVSTAQTEVAIVPVNSIWLIWLLIGLGVLILLIILAFIIRKLRKKKKKMSPKRTKTDGRSLPSLIKKNDTGRKKKKRILILAVVLAIIIATGTFVVIKIITAVNAYELLQEFADRPEYAMTLSLDTELDDQLTNADIKVTKTQVDGHTVTCVENEGISLYYADSAVIMENGKAYQISELYPDYSSLPAESAKIFQMLSCTTSRSGEKATCSLTAEGENARTLLKIFLPEQLDNLSDTQKLTVQLTSVDNEIQSLLFSSEGTLVDDAKTPYTISAELKPVEIDESFAVPEPVKETVCSGQTESGTAISEDLFRLLSAWTDLSQEEAFTSNVTLGVNCSPISLNESMKYERTIVDGQGISCIRKNDLIVYFANGSFCDQNGLRLNAQDNELIDRAHLLEVLYQVCLNGEFKCADTGNDTWLYTLTLDEAAMKEVAYAAAPQMENLPAILNSGSIQIMVKGTSLTELDCNCTGGLEALAETVPVTVSAKMSFTHNSGSEVPNAVQDQLIQERMEKNGQ
jgi:hypothetical protein